MHLLVAILAGRKITAVPLVPLTNLIVAGLVLLYWASRWYGYLTQGVTVAWSDQWIPAAALVVVVLACLSLAGRPLMTIQWIILAIDTVVFVLAALFVTFFQMKMF